MSSDKQNEHRRKACVAAAKRGSKPPSWALRNERLNVPSAAYALGAAGSSHAAREAGVEEAKGSQETREASSDDSVASAAAGLVQLGKFRKLG